MSGAQRESAFRWEPLVVGLVVISTSACSLLTDWDGFSNEASPPTPDASGVDRIHDGGVVAPPLDDGTAPASPDSPILGSKVIPASYWYNNPPDVPVDAYQFVAHYTGSVRTISFFLDRRTTAGATVQVGLYSESNGRPATLLASGIVATVVTEAWNTATVSKTPVVSGQNYWIAFLTPNDSATLSLRITSGGGVAVEGASNLPALPMAWTTKSVHDGSPASAFALP